MDVHACDGGVAPHEFLLPEGCGVELEDSAAAPGRTQQCERRRTLSLFSRRMSLISCPSTTCDMTSRSTAAGGVGRGSTAAGGATASPYCLMIDSSCCSLRPAMLGRDGLRGGTEAV